MQESKVKIRFVQSKFMLLHALRWMIYAVERKEGKPQSTAQANAKVTFHTITTL